MSTEVVDSAIAATAPSSRGLVGVLRGVVIVIVLFLGYKVLPFYYYYYDIKAYCAQVVRDAEAMSDDEIRAKLLALVRQHGIDKDAHDIRVQRVGSRVKVWVDYEEPVDVSLGNKRTTLFTIPFSPSAERLLDE